MKLAYSCVVDGRAKFEWQAVLLCDSLLRNAGANPEDIKVHVTPAVSPEFRGHATECGLRLVEVEPFPVGPGYCNKIRQTTSGAFFGYDWVLLCDCDLYFLRPVALPAGADLVACGRVVDRPNPPLNILRALYAQQGLSPPAVRPVSFAETPDELTFATNWNGGFYLVRGSQIERFGRRWADNAMALADQEDTLGRYHVHIDQIAFAMALDQLGAAIQVLEAGINVPTHLGELTRRSPAPSGVVCLHYHDRQDGLGQIAPTGSANLDAEIGRANDQIRELIGSRFACDPAFRTVLNRWQLAQGRPLPKEVEKARESFLNPRYRRHTARRLEHLASLRLDLQNKTVLELGAGIGEHSQFFLDRGCWVLSVEPRDANVHAICQRHVDPLGFLPGDRHLVLKASADAAVDLLAGRAAFQVVYNYGLLYHLSDPIGFLKRSAALCEGLYLLETAVSDLVSGQTAYVEEKEDLTNAIDGECVLVSRRELFATLREYFPHVYVPISQPAHEQFLMDWARAPDGQLGRHRAIFVASTREIDSPLLSPELVMIHDG